MESALPDIWEFQATRTPAMCNMLKMNSLWLTAWYLPMLTRIPIRIRWGHARWRLTAPITSGLGGHQNRWHERIDGQTGGTLTAGTQRPCGGYGGIVDAAGILWSVRGSGTENQLLRFDPAAQSSQCISVTNSYGLAANTLGHIWNSKFQINSNAKLSSTGSVLIANTQATAPEAIWYRGVVVTPGDNDVWTAATGRDDLHIPPFAVTRHTNAGSLRKIIQLDPVGGREPTGVAVDSRGYIWVTNKASDNVMRINPDGGADGLGIVDIITSLGSNAFPYNYSDMTGVNIYHTIAPAGVWTAVYDSRRNGTIWQTISWNGQSAGGTVTVKARATDFDYNLGKKLYIPVANNVPLGGSIVGRFLQVRIQLTASSHAQPWPTVQNLTITAPCPSASSIASVVPSQAGTIDARQPHPSSTNALEMRQGLGRRFGNSQAGPTEPIRIQLSPSVLGAHCSNCWQLCETGIEEVETGDPPLSPNKIHSVTEVLGASGRYDIFLDRPISAGHWTMIQYLGAGLRLSYASLPADVNGNGTAAPVDILTLIDYLNGVGSVPFGTYSCDIDHSGICAPADILAIIDLLNGAGTFIVWSGRVLPTNTCIGGSGGGGGGGICADASCGEDTGPMAMAMSQPGESFDPLSENQEFADYVVNFISSYVPSEALHEDGFEVIVQGLLEWCVDHFSFQERSDLAHTLEAASYASETGAFAANEFIEALSP